VLAAGELRPIHLAGPPEQTGQNQVERQGAANESLRARYFFRGSRARLPRERSCAQGHGSLAVARHRQNHINVGTATECAFASVVLRPSGIENVRIRDRLQRRYSALGQTKKSLGRVHLPKELADDLWLWKQECPASSPEAFIFPDAKDGFMDTGNYRRRVLHKLAKDLELPKLTFQVIRRTIATLAQKKGTVKDRFQACWAALGKVAREPIRILQLAAAAFLLSIPRPLR
jgi:hypothetical protein